MKKKIMALLLAVVMLLKYSVSVLFFPSAANRTTLLRFRRFVFLGLG